MTDLLIIGAGPTGLYAGFCAGLRKLNAVVLESLPYVGGQLTSVYKEKPIYDIPGFDKIKAGDFIDNLYKQYKEFENEVKIHLMTQVLNIINKGDYYLVETNNGNFETKCILIANGGGVFSPRLLEVENAKDKENIFYHISDMNVYKDKVVTILGGGDSALDWGVALSSVCKRVNLVHRREEFRAHGSTVDKYMVLKNTSVFNPYVVKDVIGDKRVDKVVLENVNDGSIKEIETDYLFVNYGFKASKNVYTEWGVETENNSIKVNSDMSTNMERIFACGNCVTYNGKLKMIVTGLGEASTAIGSINNILHPGRNTNLVFSSSLLKK